jgi:tetratricopeptide (TPR) repeat protein
MADGPRRDVRQLARLYLTREPAILAILTGIAVVLFAAVGVLSRTFHAQQESLGQRWFNRGVPDLKARRFDAAASEFRAALRYSRDDYSYQLNLAEALTGLNRTSEAQSYFINLWERQPEDGLVNLELARIAAQKQETEQALRYYHNAIYATWPANEEVERRDARLELIEFLLHIHSRAQAQAEMIALEASLGEDPEEQAKVAELFLRAQDYEHALAAFRMTLRANRRNAAALAGAGRTAYELAQYPAAQRYLQAAVAADSNDAQSAEMLKTTEMVLAMDPFRPGVSSAQRSRIVMRAFEAAGERLKACGRADDQWTKMKPQISESRLRGNSDLEAAAMEVVFNVERQTSASCGAPAGQDLALLLVGKVHEGN